MGCFEDSIFFPPWVVGLDLDLNRLLVGKWETPVSPPNPAPNQL